MRISLEDDVQTLHFAVSEDEPTAEFITVLDDTTGSAVWGLAADATGEYEVVDLAVDDQNRNAPHDTNHCKSSTSESTALATRMLKYGVVPEGFRQVFPPAGAPEALVSGRTYRILVFGPIDACATFAKS